MLDQFVDAIANALPGVLAWTAVYAGLRRFGTPAAVRALLVGCAVGTAAAATLSVLRRTTALVNRELIALGLLPALLLLAGGLLVWLWQAMDDERTGRGWLRPIAAGFGFLLCLVVLPDVLLLTVGFVAPGGSVLSSEVVLNLAGYLLGLSVVVVAAWASYRAGRGASLAVARAAITVVVAIAMAGWLTTVVQILLGRRVIQLPSSLFQVAVWLINHEHWLGYAMAMVSLAPVASAWRRHRASAGDPGNPAERRLHTAAGISRRRFATLALAGFAVAVTATTLGREVAEAEPTLSEPEPLESGADSVWVGLDRLDDGHLHRFAYDTADGTRVRFIAIRKNARAFGVGLDACEICGPTGYYERGGQVICKLCDVAMNINTIGFAGGCNPVPIEYTISDGRLLVTRAALEASAGVFA